MLKADESAPVSLVFGPGIFSDGQSLENNANSSYRVV